MEFKKVFQACKNNYKNKKQAVPKNGQKVKNDPD